MSRELQERADIITQELKEVLEPIRIEIKKLKDIYSYKDYRDSKIITHLKI